MSKLIALDLDDTLHDRSNIRPGYKMGAPMPGALEAVKKMIAAGYEPYVLTASTDARRKSIEEWLRYFKFPPMRVTSEKTLADFYVDDRAVRYENWQQVLEEIGVE